MDGESIWLQALVYAFLLVVPWAFVGVGIWQLRAAQRFMEGARRVEGTVLYVERSTSIRQGRTSTTHRPTFVYQGAFGPAEVKTALWSSSYDFGTGERHQILVNPAMPGVARLPGFWVYGFGALFVFIGAVFAVAGLIGAAHL